MKDYGSIQINKVMESFVPADQRNWYPWIWPKAKWFEESDPVKVERFIEKVRHLAKTDLFFFADNIMRDPKHPPLYVGLHDEMCHLLQFGKDIGMLVPRGHLKSTLASGALPIWLLGNNPNLRIVIASAVSELAESLISYISAQLSGNPRLKIVFPNLIPAGHDLNALRVKTWNKQAIEIKREKILKEPSILAMGMDKQPKTGFHFDVKINDDIVTKENADTPEKMRKTKENLEYSLNLLDLNSWELYVGTRYNDGDCYGDKIRAGDAFYIRKATEGGKYCWPIEANIVEVEKKRKRLSPYIFACQMQNDPIVKGDAEFEQEWVRRWNHNLLRTWMNMPTATDEDVFWAWVKTLDLHLGCDPNRTDKKRSDFGVIMVVGVDIKGHEYGLFIKHKKMKTEEIVMSFIEAFDFWKPKTARIETIGGDVHVFNTIKAKMKEKLMPSGRVGEYEKNMRMSGDDRIRELQFPMSQGQIWFGPGSEWDEIIHEELLRFPYGAHDDGITTWAYIHSQQAKPKKEVKKLETLGDWQRRLYGGYDDGNWQTA